MIKRPGNTSHPCRKPGTPAAVVLWATTCMSFVASMTKQARGNQSKNCELLSLWASKESKRGCSSTFPKTFESTRRSSTRSRVHSIKLRLSSWVGTTFLNLSKKMCLSLTPREIQWSNALQNKNWSSSRKIMHVQRLVITKLSHSWLVMEINHNWLNIRWTQTQSPLSSRASRELLQM